MRMVAVYLARAAELDALARRCKEAPLKKRSNGNSAHLLVPVFPVVRTGARDDARETVTVHTRERLGSHEPSEATVSKLHPFVCSSLAGMCVRCFDASLNPGHVLATAQNR
jgi:hypothetical protein